METVFKNDFLARLQCVSSEAELVLQAGSCSIKFLNAADLLNQLSRSGVDLSDLVIERDDERMFLVSVREKE